MLRSSVLRSTAQLCAISTAKRTSCGHEVSGWSCQSVRLHPVALPGRSKTHSNRHQTIGCVKECQPYVHQTIECVKECQPYVHQTIECVKEC